MEAGFILLLLVVFVVGLRLFAGNLDHERIAADIAARGGRMQSIEWDPLGPGWFGSKNERIYRVLYLDRDGHQHQASCKTSMLAGVYFSNDEIINRAPTEVGQTSDDAVWDPPGPSSSTSELERENVRLRAEIERLRGQQGRGH